MDHLLNYFLFDSVDLTIQLLKCDNISEYGSSSLILVSLGEHYGDHTEFCGKGCRKH
jgi:hypothetical protein